MVRNIRIGHLVDPIIPFNNGSHESARGIANTTAGHTPVVVKRLPHHELVREVLCSLLAQAVDLPVPQPYVLDVRDSSWPEQRGATHVFGTSYGTGRSWARAARQGPATIANLVAWPKFLAAIAFDEWIANSDRDPGNLLFIGPREFQLIDHGEALPNRLNRADTKLPNRLARHLAGNHLTANGRKLAQRVLESCANFGTVNFGQIELAALVGAWGGQPEFGEAIRLLKDRLRHLPMLVEEEFRVNQGQLLA